MKATEVTAPTAATVSRTMPQASDVSQSLWYLAPRSLRQPLGVVVILILCKSRLEAEGECPNKLRHRGPREIQKKNLYVQPVFCL